MSPLLIVLGLITGTMIGSIGVGGVLLVPVLFYGMGFDLHIATALSSWSFLFTGIVGTYTYWRLGRISWAVVGWLTAGILPGAFLGARSNLALSSSVVILALAILIFASGVNTLFSGSKGDQSSSSLGSAWLVLLGLVTGFGSALTGTGGPVLLVPILMFMNVQALAAVAASQVVQIPIALSAAIGFNIFSESYWLLGTMLGLVQAVGVVLGARIAILLNAQQMRRVVAIALIAVAVLMFARLAFT